MKQFYESFKNIRIFIKNINLQATKYYWSTQDAHYEKSLWKQLRVIASLLSSICPLAVREDLFLFYHRTPFAELLLLYEVSLNWKCACWAIILVVSVLNKVYLLIQSLFCRHAITINNLATIWLLRVYSMN